MILESPEPITKRRSRASKLIVIIVSVLILAAAGAGLGFFVASKLAGPAVAVPASIVQKAKSPIYLPTKLPGKYVLEPKSFSFSEDTVLFTVSDGAGGTIVFAEQALPKSLDFDDFYSKQLSDTKTLSNVPYASVSGKTMDGRRVLSVVAENTWVFISTNSPIDDSALQQIAAGLARN